MQPCGALYVLFMEVGDTGLFAQPYMRYIKRPLPKVYRCCVSDRLPNRRTGRVKFDGIPVALLMAPAHCGATRPQRHRPGRQLWPEAEAGPHVDAGAPAEAGISRPAIHCTCAVDAVSLFCFVGFAGR